MKILGLITARGGSKGLPGKNLLDLAGKPLIGWTCEAALRASGLDAVLLSTDDERIAHVARGYGVDVPFLRPKSLAADDTPHIDVVEHSLTWLRQQRGYAPEFLLLLQPTSPLRDEADIEQAIAILAAAPHSPAVLGVTPVKHHPYLVKALAADGSLTPYLPGGPAYPRRQDLPPALALNGAIFLNNVETLLRDRTFAPAGARPYIMPADRSIDIDSEADLALAAWLMSKSPRSSIRP